MVASFLEFDHSGTIETTLPTFLFSHFNKYLCRWIFRTLSGRVHLVVAYAAYPCPAPLTLPYFATIFEVDMVRFDPFATMTSRAVDTIPSGVLLKFPVPCLFELLVKELVNMLERNVLSSAAFGWHVGRIGNRHCKYAAQAIVAHPMSTCKFRSLDEWDVIRTTSEAGYFLQTHLSGWRTSKQC